ncbi:MAG: hypothetical protein IIB83_04190 [Bacteroidetes bacterium]|nr:hypothetical protein [Bacteroidota bacterium]MCH8325751.1 hypothetical protein [Bacteroidota bacterium]
MTKQWRNIFLFVQTSVKIILGFLRILIQRVGAKKIMLSAWLIVVVNHLCIDEHRSQYGRKRLHSSLGYLSPVEF